jgi:hypothetical protein
MSYFRGLRGSVPVALGLSLMLLTDGLLVATPVAADDEAPATVAGSACVSGFGHTASKSDMSLHGVTWTEKGVLAVGYSRSRQAGAEFGRRRPASVLNQGGPWTRLYTDSPGEEDGLIAVDSKVGRDTWAVGFTTIEGRVMPLAMRWDGKRWSTSRPDPVGRLTSLFTDVALVGGGTPFAVGFRMTGSGKRQPIAARRSGGGWSYVPVGIGKRESVSFTGISTDGGDGAWVVGHGGPGAEVDPVIYRRRDGRWARQKVPNLAGEAVLADVVASGRREAWAVGYQRAAGRTDPLVMRWNGKRWRKMPAPTFESPGVHLTAVSAPSSGGVWVVGAAWDDAAASHQAVAAWWDGQAWIETSGRTGGTELNDVFGSLDRDGWAVGRAGPQARTTRVCIPPQSAIFGASEVEPGGAGPRGAGPGDVGPPAESLPADALTAAHDDDHDHLATESEALEAGSATLLAKKKARARKNAKARKAKARARAQRKARQRARKRAATVLPVARPDADIVARDVAGSAGLAEVTGTYDAVVDDFDGDGLDDIYIGRHGRSGRLMINQGGTFKAHGSLQMPSIDRHGCTSADIDGSGLPDLYCTIGGKRGTGLKANELWLDPGGPAPRNVGVDRGLADETGRGRDAVFLEATSRDDVSLLVANSPVRADGLPSIGRHYLTQRDGQFRSRVRPGFAPRLGALAMQDADFGGDGREDLLMVVGGNQSPVQSGTRLYRNTRKGLEDVTRETGIRSIDEVDAELVDLNGDGKLDLVQLAEDKIRVSILKNGRYRRVWQRSLTHGRAIASGDVNGDGRGDLYIVRSNGERNSPDVMLLNRKGGSSWSAVDIPQVADGSGDDAYAIDHDGNGLDDFVVLNGRNDRGPIQLTAFYERAAASVDR